MILRAAVTLLLLCAVVQIDAAGLSFWGEDMMLPEPLSSDSTPFTFTHRQNLGQGTYSLEDSAFVTVAAGHGRLEQKVLHLFSEDRLLSRQRSQMLDISGSWMRPIAKNGVFSTGLEWMPAGQLSGYEMEVGNDTLEAPFNDALITLRAGPVFAVRYLNLPVSLSGGPAFDVWQNTMPGRITDGVFDSTHTDAGMYFRFSAGDQTRQLVDGVPFYAGGSILGNYLEKSKFTVGNVQGLLAADLPFADSLFVYAKDSVSVGRTATMGRGSYSASPDRTRNIFRAGLGVRDIGSLALRPTLLWNVQSRREGYMPYTQLLGEERFTGNTVLVGARDVGGIPLDGAGWLSLTFDNLDMLPGADFGRYPSSTDHAIDSLIENAKDYKGFAAVFHQDLGVVLFERLELSYRLELQRDRRLYLNPWRNGTDTSSSEDRDRVVRQQTGEAGLRLFANTTLGCRVEYLNTQSVYLQSELSAGNKTVQQIYVDPVLKVDKEAFGASVVCGGSASRSQWHFPKFHLDDAPPWTRTYYVGLTAAVHPETVLSGDASVKYIYIDDGLNMTAQQQGEAAAAGTTGYGLTNISHEVNVDASLTARMNNGIVLKLSDAFRTHRFKEFKVVWDEQIGIARTTTNTLSGAMVLNDLFDKRLAIAMKIRLHNESNRNIAEQQIKEGDPRWISPADENYRRGISNILRVVTDHFSDPYIDAITQLTVRF